MLSMMDESERSHANRINALRALSPPLKNNKFAPTPPARSNSTPPGRNSDPTNSNHGAAEGANDYGMIDPQTEMMLKQFGSFDLNEEVSVMLLVRATRS
jgi:hypothetical protein